MTARATELTNPKVRPPARDVLIRNLGRLLDDLERVRVANGNRIGALEREYGDSLPHLDVIQKQLRAAEHLAEIELVRAWRKHPLAAWAKGIRGVGEKSMARLIAEIGSVSEASDYDRAPLDAPNPGKLLAYCGHGEPSRQRRKGMTQAELFKAGNPSAKKRVFLIAESMLKTGNRALYDVRREATKDRGWTLGHAHADALRIVGKRFLIELWTARAGQDSNGIQSNIARAGQGPGGIEVARVQQPSLSVGANGLASGEGNGPEFGAA